MASSSENSTDGNETSGGSKGEIYSPYDLSDDDFNDSDDDDDDDDDDSCVADDDEAQLEVVVESPATDNRGSGSGNNEPMSRQSILFPTASAPTFVTGSTSISTNVCTGTTMTNDTAARTDAHQLEMNLLKQKEYRDMNETLKLKIEAKTEQFQNPMMMEPFLLWNCDEYERLKDIVDRKYDVQERYCGRIIGMGSNEHLQLFNFKSKKTSTTTSTTTVGENDTNSDKPPTTLCFTATRDVIHMVSAGGLHSVAILATTGQVISWGDNRWGALGRITDKSVQTVRSSLITGFYTYPHRTCEDYNIVQIAAGDTHTLFLSAAGNVYQCGSYIDLEDNKYSDKDFFAMPDDKDNVLSMNRRPVHVCALSQLHCKVESIYAGRGYNAALLNDGTLVTWGIGLCGNLVHSANTSPKLDKNSQYSTKEIYLKMCIDEEGKERLIPDPDIIQQYFLTPKPVVFADENNNRSIIAVACGAFHMLVVARDNQDPNLHGKLYSCGLNDFGQLGHGDVNVDRHALTLVEAVKDIDFSQVAAGEHFSLALSHDRSQLYSFGRSDSGQLGVGVEDLALCVALPQRVVFPESAIDISSIEAGNHHAFCFTADNKLYSWGCNQKGATGHPQADSKFSGSIFLPQVVDGSYLKRDMKGNTGCHPVDISYGIPVYVSCGRQHTLILTK